MLIPDAYITIDNLDPDVLTRLQTEANRRGVDVAVLVKELVHEALGPPPRPTADAIHHDLDTLAGTWSDEDAGAFLDVVADLDA